MTPENQQHLQPQSNVADFSLSPRQRTAQITKTPQWRIWGIVALCHGLIFITLAITSSSEPLSKSSPKIAPAGLIEALMEQIEVKTVVTDLQMDDLSDPIFDDDMYNTLDTLETRSLPTEREAVIAVSSPDHLVTKNTFTRISMATIDQIDSNAVFASSFCGTRTTAAKKICFIVDHSGSMVIAFEYVRKELLKAIKHLSPAQSFHIIFFADSQPMPLPNGHLRRATVDNRKQSAHFVSQVKTGTFRGLNEQPWQGLAKAVELAIMPNDNSIAKPDLIYILTDGEFNHEKLSQSISEVQRKLLNKVAINVISCGNVVHNRSLSKLANNNQGRFHFVTIQEIDRAILY